MPAPSYSTFDEMKREQAYEALHEAQKLRDRIGLVSEAQFAAMMEVSEYTTQVWRVKGTGPLFVKLGRSVFYRLQDIEAWMAQNLHSSTETTGPITSRDMVKEELDAMFAPIEGPLGKAA